MELIEQLNSCHKINNYSSSNLELITKKTPALNKDNNNLNQEINKKLEKNPQAVQIYNSKMTNEKEKEIKDKLFKEIATQKTSNLNKYANIPTFQKEDFSPILNNLEKINNEKNSIKTPAINSNTDNKNSNYQRLSNLRKKKESKLDKQNLVIKEFKIGESININNNYSNSNTKNINDVSHNCLLEKINEVNVNEEENIYSKDDNSINNNDDINNINEINDINNNDNNLNINFDLKNFIIENFEIIFLSKKEKKNNEKKIPSDAMKIFSKNRPFIFPIKQKVDCFSVTITKEKKIQITNKNIQGLIKILIIMTLYFGMWFMMAVFINNLVEKYGSSTFSVCILPVFTMFFVKLIVTANVQFFIMAVVLKYRGKRYLNIVKKPMVDFIIFKALVHPMALDHFESILFYQEYLKYWRIKQI